MLRIFLGFNWIRLESHEYFQKFTTVYKNLLGSSPRALGGISVKSVKNKPNPVQIKKSKFCEFVSPAEVA